MKAVAVALFCALLMVASRPAQALGDELDDLFASDPVGAPSVVAASEDHSDESADLDFADRHAPGYADPSHWQSAIGVSASLPARHKPASTSAAKPAPLGDLNVVPEPSAVALAALALIYFLVFGRRRRVQ